MADDIVLLEIEGSVAKVTLNRPDVHNAFDEETIARLTAVFADLGKRTDIAAVVLRGRGKSFSAGGDLNWMKRAAGYSEKQNYEDALKLAAMLQHLYELPQATIACVQGAAMGGGLGLVSCCDIVIAEEDAIFALSEVKLGLIPATIGPYVLRAIGPRQARRFFQTGERFDVQKALSIGLVHEIAGQPEDTDYILGQALKNIQASGPDAVRAAKRLVGDLAHQEIDAELRQETARLIAATRAGDEAKEGIAAFLEKRKANWNKS
jgi:methylglutaconyl-CoA hydratase